ncbi:nuclease-related domain-containing protein [Streptomyces albidoflavus]|uniref:nuclease-related domain-containing protein n=1 Tax=Streptomyces albidoflavus TaxID=1886 RepID=UPI0010208980|nr:NERD domain-containing protein [Streptomyces albidoflavus]RZF02933.1 hypothetical protein C0R05_32505 [Streptomyces albidoflavus]
MSSLGWGRQPSIDLGKAGASARRMYDEENAGHRARRTRWRATAGVGALLLPAVALADSAPPSVAAAVALLTSGAGVWAAERLHVRLHGEERGTSWRIGAEGEEATAELLKPMSRRGWVWLHDRSVQGRQFNLDHIGVPPDGAELYAVETKRWPRGWVVSLDGRGRLLSAPIRQPYRTRSQEKDVDAFIRETDAMARYAEKLPLVRYMAIHGAGVSGGRMKISRYSEVLGRPVDIHVVDAARLPLDLSARTARMANTYEAQSVAAWAARRFPRR